MKKIAIVNMPLYGHTIPVLPLIKALVQAGHEVHYYNTPEFAWVAERAGAVMKPYSSLISKHPAVDLSLIVFHDEITCVISEIKDSFVENNYDVIIYDNFCVWAAYLSIAYKIPLISVQLSHPNIPQTSWPDATYSFVRPDEENLQYIEKFGLGSYLVEHPKQESLQTVETSRMLEDVIQHCSRQHDFPLKHHWDLYGAPAPLNIVLMPKELYGFQEALPDTVFHFVGSLQHIDPPGKKSKSAKSSIYVSLGTITKTIEPVVRRLAEQTDGQASYLIAAMDEHEKLLQYTSSNIRVVEFADQIEALKIADACIVHGGMSGIQEAILAQTPMLVIPNTEEQTINAKLIVKHGLGRYLPARTLGKINLHEEVLKLAQDAKVKENLRVWRKKIIDAGGVKRAVELIEEYTS